MSHLSGSMLCRDTNNSSGVKGDTYEALAVTEMDNKM